MLLTRLRQTWVTRSESEIIWIELEFIGVKCTGYAPESNFAAITNHEEAHFGASLLGAVVRINLKRWVQAHLAFLKKTVCLQQLPGIATWLVLGGKGKDLRGKIFGAPLTINGRGDIVKTLRAVKRFGGAECMRLVCKDCWAKDQEQWFKIF